MIENIEQCTIVAGLLLAIFATGWFNKSTEELKEFVEYIENPREFIDAFNNKYGNKNN